ALDAEPAEHARRDRRHALPRHRRADHRAAREVLHQPALPLLHPGDARWHARACRARHGGAGARGDRSPSPRPLGAEARRPADALRRRPRDRPRQPALRRRARRGLMPARAPGWPAVLAVAAVALAAQLPIYDRWVSFMDEGHILAFADILAKGGELYRDATLYPLPGAFYLLAGAFRTFGTSLFVAALFVLLRRLVSPRLALVGVALLLVYRIWAFPHWQMYSYSSTALCL